MAWNWILLPSVIKDFSRVSPTSEQLWINLKTKDLGLTDSTWASQKHYDPFNQMEIRRPRGRHFTLTSITDEVVEFTALGGFSQRTTLVSPIDDKRIREKRKIQTTLRVSVNTYHFGHLLRNASKQETNSFCKWKVLLKKISLYPQSH